MKPVVWLIAAVFVAVAAVASVIIIKHNSTSAFTIQNNAPLVSDFDVASSSVVDGPPVDGPPVAVPACERDSLRPGTFTGATTIWFQRMAVTIDILTTGHNSSCDEVGTARTQVQGMGQNITADSLQFGMNSSNVLSINGSNSQNWHQITDVLSNLKIQYDVPSDTLRLQADTPVGRQQLTLNRQ